MLGSPGALSAALRAARLSLPCPETTVSTALAEPQVCPQGGPLCLSPAELTAAHFGGGAGQRHGKEGEDGEQPAKSRKELIEELIARSKQEKVSQPVSPLGAPALRPGPPPAELRLV